MVPNKFNMIDLDGLDIIESQGVIVSGLYDKLVESIALCRYQCIYNWKFNSIPIPPTYVELESKVDGIWINDGIVVSQDDTIHIYTIEPDPTVINPLNVVSNGVYNVTEGVTGFNPVTVNVPSYTPVINPISIIENGIYTAPDGVDGYSPISVDVPSGAVDWAGLFSFTTRNEDSMSWSKSAGYLQSIWNGGSSIGADSWIEFDATNVNTISVDVEAGTSYSDTTPKWYIMLALMSTNPASINYPANNYQTNFLEYDEFHTRNSSGTLTIDVSNYTGLNYIVLSTIGWNVKFTNLTFTVAG